MAILGAELQPENEWQRDLYNRGWRLKYRGGDGIPIIFIFNPEGERLVQYALIPENAWLRARMEEALPFLDSEKRMRAWKGVVTRYR